MSEPKAILVIAQERKSEALRMASGLTLLDDHVSVSVVGELERDAATEEQMEALEFAEVPVCTGADREPRELARRMADADVVFIL